MGIVRSNAAFYLEAHGRGVAFGRTLTLGRQRFYVTPDELRDLAARYRPDLAGASNDLPFGGPADTFFGRFLGARDLAALDHSAYEGATITHDLNVPVPVSLEQSFDAVIDSGTLEHVFNVPVALASCLRLVKPGGTLFLCSPANNMCGHGFYQFSPELFFRVLDRANGYTLTRMILVTHPFPGAELSRRQAWYEVTDPAAIGARAPLMTSRPAFLMVEAKRIGDVPAAILPQQSDYVTKWAAETGAGPRRSSVLGALARWLPPGARNLAIGWYQRAFLCTLRNRRAFRRV